MDVKVETKLSYKGYEVDKSNLNNIKKIKKELTVSPNNYDPFKRNKREYFNVYQDVGNKLLLPKYKGINLFGDPIINDFNDYEYTTIDIKYNGDLREKQKVIVSNILDGIKKHNGGLLIAGCGTGKTNIALYVMCQLKVKTLWIVHKTFLKKQIIDRMEEFTNINKNDVGIIQGDKVIVNKNVIVSTVQTLSKRDFDDDFFKDIGLIIIDEVHHMAAQYFSKTLQKVVPKYTLGITAEKNRNDGLFHVLEWFLGPILHYEKQPPVEDVMVKKILYTSTDKNFKEIYIRGTGGEPNRAGIINNLIKIDARNELIINIIRILSNNNRKILFLSGRIEHLKNLYTLLYNIDPKYIDISGFYIGSMKEKDLEISRTRNIIFASYEMAQEGLDIPALNAVVLSTPKSSVNQAVYRILRKESYDIKPIIIDICDNLNSLNKQASKRDKFYKLQKYKIYDLKVDDSNYNDYELLKDHIENEHKNIEYKPVISEKKNISHNIDNICLFDD